ncbi:MAG TPA: ABC transporter substrate-binding protein, partial [Bacillota bacterium]|nr:ABC transporter substrate-binding protein [Bacillota bacterium]
MRRIALALLLILMLSAAAASAAKDDSGVFRIGVLTDAKNLNPYFGFHGTETMVTGEIYDTLFNYDEVEKKLKGNIVSKWETKDNYTWRMTINPNFKWSDGKPLRVEDIVFTYEMILKNKFPGQMAILATFKSVKKVDDRSFDMTFTTPAVSNLRFAGTAILIVPEHIWSQIKQPRAFANLEPVGSGPMVLKEKVDGQYIVMEVRKDHPTRKYNFDRMELIVVRDQTMGILSLRDGAFDFFDDRIPPQIAEDIKNNPGQYKNVKVDVNNTTSITTLMFNLRKAPFSDIKFRQAVAYSIDSEKLIKTVLMGYGTVA